jgi:hypothetical protein
MSAEPTKREPLMDQSYFDKEVTYNTETIARFNTKLAESTAPAKNRAKFAYSIFRKNYELLISRYSRGEAVSEIKAQFPATVESLVRYQAMEGHQEMMIDKSLDDYVTAFWLVSLAIVFNVDAGLFTKLVACLGGAGKDRLLDRLIATRIPDRPVGKQLAWAKIYKTLDEAIDAAPAHRPKLLQTFLAGWYGALKEVYWYDNHKGPDGGGFFGYWSIEAAGVVSAFGFDDQAFRNLPYYPKDLAIRPA